MVRVTDYHAVKNERGETFYALSIQGGVELVRSEETGNFYATARKTRITTTFNEETCKSLVGSELPGKVVKYESEPYEYAIPDTGEVITLEHKYSYMPDEVESMEEAILTD